MSNDPNVLRATKPYKPWPRTDKAEYQPRAEKSNALRTLSDYLPCAAPKHIRDMVKDARQAPNPLALECCKTAKRARVSDRKTAIHYSDGPPDYARNLVIDETLARLKAANA